MKYEYLLLFKAFKKKFNYSTSVYFFRKNDIKLFFFFLKKFFFLIKNIDKLPLFTYKNYFFFKNSIDFNFLNFFKFFLEKEQKNYFLTKKFNFFDEEKNTKIVNKFELEKKIKNKNKFIKKNKKYDYSLNKFKVLKTSTNFNEYWNTDLIKEGFDALWDRFQLFNQDCLWGTPILKDKLLRYRAKMNDSDGMGCFEIYARQRLNKAFIDNKKNKNMTSKVYLKNRWFTKRKRLGKKKITNWTRVITYEELIRHNKQKRALDAMKALEKIENEKRRIGMEKAKAKEDRWEIVKDEVFTQVMNRRFSFKKNKTNTFIKPISEIYLKKIYINLKKNNNKIITRLTHLACKRFGLKKNTLKYTNSLTFIKEFFVKKSLKKKNIFKKKNIVVNNIEQKNLKKRVRSKRRIASFRKLLVAKHWIIENRHLKKKSKNKKLFKNKTYAKNAKQAFLRNAGRIKTETWRNKVCKIKPKFLKFSKYILKFKYKNFILKNIIQNFDAEYLRAIKNKNKKKKLKHSDIILNKINKLTKLGENNYFLFYSNLYKLLMKFNKVKIAFMKYKKNYIKRMRYINSWIRLRWWRERNDKNFTKHKAFRLIKKAKFRKLVKKFEKFRSLKEKANNLKFKKFKKFKIIKYKLKLKRKKSRIYKIKNKTKKLFNIISLRRKKNYSRLKKKFIMDVNDIFFEKSKKTKKYNSILLLKNFNKKMSNSKGKFNFAAYNLFLKEKLEYLFDENISKTLFFKKNLKKIGFKPYFIDFKKNLDLKFHIINIYNIIKRGSLINGGQFIFTTHNIIENMNLFYQYQYEKWILKLLFMKNTYFRWFSTYISNTPFMSHGAKYFFDQQKLALVNIVKPTLLDFNKFKCLVNTNKSKKNFNANRTINIIVQNYFHKVFYSSYSVILTRFNFKNTGKVISNYLAQLTKTVRFEAIRPDFILEFINVCALTFFSKDPKPLVKWIIKVINKISHKKHWKFLFLLKVNILKLAFKFAKETNFAGFHLRVRGKIGALGCVRKKIVHVKMGEYGFSKYYLKGDIYYLSATTITGKIGVKMILCYR